MKEKKPPSSSSVHQQWKTGCSRLVLMDKELRTQEASSFMFKREFSSPKQDRELPTSKKKEIKARGQSSLLFWRKFLLKDTIHGHITFFFLSNGAWGASMKEEWWPWPEIFDFILCFILSLRFFLLYKSERMNLGDEIIRLWIVSQHWRLDSWKDECYPDQAFMV